MREVGKPLALRGILGVTGAAIALRAELPSMGEDVAIDVNLS